jgi:hypothetical protein
VTMTRIFRLRVMLIVASLASAQTNPGHVFIIQSKREYTPTNQAITSLRKIITSLDPSKLRAAESGSWENQVLIAAEQSAGVTLRLRLSDPDRVGIYTLKTDEGDTLVARWNGAGSDRPDRAVWLWDTPFYTTFVVEVDAAVLRITDLIHYCENLFLWDQDPLQLTSLGLAYIASESGKEQATGLGRYIQTERGSYQLWFAALSTRAKAYVAVGMSKAIFSDRYPPEAYQVRERFPRLASLLINVSRDELFGELGKGYVPPQILSYPTNRDAIVLSALLSRGPLSDSKVEQVVIGALNKGDSQSALVVNSRLIAFLTALEGRNELAVYAPALEKVFLGARIHRGYEDSVIGHLFGAMERHQIDFSHAALKFLEHGQFGRPSLYYLEKNVRDEKTLRKLSDIAVKADLDQERNVVLKNIERRLGSKQNPQ